MKNKKLKIFPLLLLTIFLVGIVSNFVLLSKSYANNKEFDEKCSIEYMVSSKPSSKSYSSPGSSKSYSKPKTSTIKPDSGSFSTKPNKNSSSNKSNSSTKPDSGSFTTKPKNNNNNKTYDNKDYDNYPKNNKRIFSGGYYGGYNPFYRVMYGFGHSSWITKVVVLITIVVVIYIAIDFIRSRKD